MANKRDLAINIYNSIQISNNLKQAEILILEYEKNIKIKCIEKAHKALYNGPADKDNFKAIHDYIMEE